MDENNSDQETRGSRRGILAATGTAMVALVAGCSGGGDGAGTDEPATETATPSVRGTVSSNIEELAIVEHRPAIDDNTFPVDITVGNNGDQQTDIGEYNYSLTPYDADGNDVGDDTQGTGALGATDVSPGERVSFQIYRPLEVDPSEVARYEVTVQCTGTFEAQGVYCQ